MIREDNKTKGRILWITCAESTIRCSADGSLDVRVVSDVRAHALPPCRGATVEQRGLDTQEVDVILRAQISVLSAARPQEKTREKWLEKATEKNDDAELTSNHIALGMTSGSRSIKMRATCGK